MFVFNFKTTWVKFGWITCLLLKYSDNAYRISKNNKAKMNKTTNFWWLLIERDFRQQQQNFISTINAVLQNYKIWKETGGWTPANMQTVTSC